MGATAGWIGVADHETGRSRFDTRGLSAAVPDVQADAPAVEDSTTLVPRGTLMIETRIAPEDRPQTLLSVCRSHPWVGALSIRALPGGSVILVVSQGDAVVHATLPPFADMRTELLRLTYTWDAPARCGLLVAECADGDQLAVVELRDTMPMPLSDLRRLIVEPASCGISPDVICIAVSDRMEPVGPMPGLSGAAPLATPDGGMQPLARPSRGDLVATPGGHAAPILKTVSRLLPACGSYRPVLLRAPYFGLGGDIVVAPQQRLILTGSEVEYLFGREAVLVAARHLVNGVSVRWLRDAPLMWRYHQVLLAGNQPVMAWGATLESLYIGRLRRKPLQLSASVLSQCDRTRLPEHPRPAWPVLKAYEAMAISRTRAA